MSITVYGASDDLIEVDGDISEEFSYYDYGQGDFVAFSDGTVLRIHYTTAGIWRITVVFRGSSSLDIKTVAERHEEDYSDRATLGGAVWVVHGIGCATVVTR